MTQGFHPKMDMSYGPALPLGMEALREVLEFRSSRRIGAGKFLDRVNKALPRGLRFSRFEEVAPAAPSLFSATVRLVYSVDWKSEPFTTAWVAAAAPPGEGGPARPPLTASSLRTALDLFKKSRPGAETVGFRLAGRRLYLELPPSPARGLRAQDIVQAVFGLEEPVFLVRRDEVVMAPPAV
jgi:hypothetical protein